MKLFLHRTLFSELMLDFGVSFYRPTDIPVGEAFNRTLSVNLGWWRVCLMWRSSK